MPRIAENELSVLIGGEFQPPPVKIGDVVYCEMRGDSLVTGWHDGTKISWPIGRPVGQKRCGWGLLLMGKLIPAVKRESSVSLQKYLGVSHQTIRIFRRALGVPAENEGTARLRSTQKRDLRERAIVRAANAKHKRTWSAEHDAMLGHGSDKLIAIITGRSESSVYARRARLGIPACRRRFVPRAGLAAADARTREIISEIIRGEKLAEIGKKFGVTKQRIEQIANPWLKGVRSYLGHAIRNVLKRKLRADVRPGDRRMRRIIAAALYDAGFKIREISERTGRETTGLFDDIRAGGTLPDRKPGKWRQPQSPDEQGE